MKQVLNGKEAALKIKETLKEKFSNLNKPACLAIIHFNHPSSISYLKGRKKIAEEVGVIIKEYALDNTITEKELINLINSLNVDNSIQGIMIDRPLPSHLNENYILSFLSSKKDVDGYTTNNLGLLFKNESCFNCCTPYAAIRLLDYYNIPLQGKNVLVIGRSVNVGKPLAMALLNRNATVTIAHSKTTNLKELEYNADIIFLAIGKANFLKANDVKNSTIIVDIGVNFDSDGKMCGDASKDIYEKCDCYSPVPGGVGILTNVVLMENLYEACLINK